MNFVRNQWYVAAYGSEVGNGLPGWQPGAHIDLVLEPGLVRQFSLCGDPADRDQTQPAGRSSRPSVRR